MKTSAVTFFLPVVAAAVGNAASTTNEEALQTTTEETHQLGVRGVNDVSNIFVSPSASSSESPEC